MMFSNEEATVVPRTHYHQCDGFPVAGSSAVEENAVAPLAWGGHQLSSDS